MTEESSLRVGVVALIVLQHKLEEEGKVTLRPKEIRRDVHNWAKKLDLPANEVAELLKVILKKAYQKTMAELDLIQ